VQLEVVPVVQLLREDEEQVKMKTSPCPLRVALSRVQRFLYDKERSVSLN
jgi:hypothetical protein